MHKHPYFVHKKMLFLCFLLVNYNKLVTFVH